MQDGGGGVWALYVQASVFVVCDLLPASGM